MEIRLNPVLYTEGRSRYDVGQGGAGTCWFLATVSAIADKPVLLDKVIPGKAYSPEDGTFHARFWQFGKWEDVYIDDYLPVIYGDRIWGAHSKDEEEMWISLLEKAFAKHHGSYNAVDGGKAVDAFSALTGGVSESVDHKDVTNPDDFYVRINNAIKSGSYVISSVPTILFTSTGSGLDPRRLAFKTNWEIPNIFLPCRMKIQGSADSRFALENMGTKTNSYTDGAQRSFRFRLKGGNYCVVPSASKPGIEREFLIRVFTPLPLSNVSILQN
nr:hypothetical protein BaRGS_002374 [Batillaria attramentaria]